MRTSHCRGDEGDNRLRQLVAARPRLFRGHAPLVPSELPSGWHHIVHELMRKIDDLLGDDHAARFSVLQIKEKAGGLRVYWRIEPDDTSEDSRNTAPFSMIDAFVEQAENRSASTCEICGAAGERQPCAGGVRVRCSRHADCANAAT